MSEISLQQIAEIADSVEAGEPSREGVAPAVAWVSASRTDLGRVRHVNEDAFLDSPEQRLWVVADGMGGHSRGDYASGAVIRQLRAFPRKSSLLVNLQDLEGRLQAANEQCRNAFRNKQPGTTVVTMLAHGNHCFFLWAGDSRVYRLRDRALEQLTEDHSLARQKLANGQLTEEEAANHSSAHVLTRAVGIREKLELELGHSEVEAGDRYLLCTDGLYNSLDAPGIGALLGQGKPEDACEALVDLALERGGRDNITVIVVSATDGG